ncbi:MAG: hypothetical protein NXI19_04025 [Alphaproteobacteria bacterium]|nr:hypothetical protein [Alphaproteobacteria bacterium]
MAADGWTPEFQDRMNWIIGTLGSARAASRVAGYSDDQIANWRDGKSKIPLAAAMRLCAKVGKPLDWFAGMENSRREHGRFSAHSVREAATLVVAAARQFPALADEDIAESILRRAAELEFGVSAIDESVETGPNTQPLNVLR